MEFVEQSPDQSLNSRDRMIHGRSDGGTQPHQTFLLVTEGGRLACDKQKALTAPAKRPDESQHLRRIEIVGRDEQIVRGRLLVGWSLRLDDRNGTGLLAALHGVHQHGRAIAVEQGVGEIDSANAEVHDFHFRRKPPPRKSLRHLDAETVVTLEYVADTGDEDAAHLSGSLFHDLEFVWREEKPVTRHAIEAELAAGVVFEYDRHMDLVLEIALDRLDNRHFVLEHHVHNI